ncbi:MAG: hypothetical protein HQL10_01645 [Nitrospirae bacterium]|nr:hypothetical protein [Nitrospirota bacterium]
MKKQFAKIVVLTALLLFAFTITANFSYAADNKDNAQKKLFEQKCSQCHSLDEPRSQRNTKDGWTELVTRMRGNGCDLTNSEAAAIIDYLSKEFGK